MAANGKIVAYDLRCEYGRNPLGIDETGPRLSWKIAATDGFENARGLGQSAYQILVAASREEILAGRGDVWDSGKITSSKTIFIEYDGTQLVSRQRVWWTVRVWDQDGNVAIAQDPAFWEMGLLDRREWVGRWIGSTIVGGEKTEVPAPFVRKQFTISNSKAIKSARLYATALGLYEFRLNGRRVGDLIFPPFDTDYRKHIQYQVYDVTEMLRSGENVAGAILGDGWYCGYIGNVHVRQIFGDRPKLLAQIVVTFDDGSTQTIATDSSWRTTTGPILTSDLIQGETYDARLEMAGWDSADFDAAEARWQPVLEFADPSVPIVAMIGPPVRAMLELKPIEVKKLSANRWLVDLGQNMVGWARLRMKGDAGEAITLRFAEILDKNGEIYTANLRSAKQTDRYTLRGDPHGETWEPRFTFHGFRYVEISGFSGELHADDITGVVVYSDMPQTGTFECSDPLINKLQQNIQWGQRGNFIDIPTDCPQRDERLGWTGDAQVFARTAAFNFEVSGFFAKWTQDLRDAQQPQGCYPQVVPSSCDKVFKPEVEYDGGPAWGDAGIICPWTMWLAYGDVRMIERHYDSMKRFVEFLVNNSEPFGHIRSHPEWKGFHGFGDWLSQDGKDGLFGATPKDLIGTAFAAYDCRLMAQIARALSRQDDAAKYESLAEQFTAAFRRRFVTAEGLLVGHTQTPYVLALHFDLLPESQRPSAIDNLVRNIRANGSKLNTGFVGSGYLNHVLTRFGKLDVAYELLMQQQWPSWLYAVTQGATTIWERWDGWTHDKGFQDPGMNSFNHYAYGAIGAWLYQTVAGIDIDPARPGYEHVIFRPHTQLGGPLSHASAALDSPRGMIKSGWRIDPDSAIEYNFEIPPNVTATTTLRTSDPAGVLESGKPLNSAMGVKIVSSNANELTLELLAGRYQFTVRR